MARVRQNRGPQWVTVAPGPRGNDVPSSGIRGSIEASGPLQSPGDQIAARSVCD